MLQVEPGTPFITQAAPRLGSELCVNESRSPHAADCSSQSAVGNDTPESVSVEYTGFTQ